MENLKNGLPSVFMEETNRSSWGRRLWPLMMDWTKAYSPSWGSLLAFSRCSVTKNMKVVNGSSCISLIAYFNKPMVGLATRHFKYMSNVKFEAERGGNSGSVCINPGRLFNMNCWTSVCVASTTILSTSWLFLMGYLILTLLKNVNNPWQMLSFHYFCSTSLQVRAILTRIGYNMNILVGWFWT